MKKFFVAAVAAVALTSCAAGIAPVTGLVYTNVKGPIAATDNTVGSKVGTSSAKSILGIIGTGDASIDAAAKNAGITKISHVDYETKSILGIVATVKIHVYGE